MVDFPYDKSWYLKDLFFSWAFKPIKHFNRKTPDSSNLFEIPESLKIKKSLEVLKKH